MAGLWYDELTVGLTFEHAIRRTVTETDNVLFTAMTNDAIPSKNPGGVACADHDQGA
jgi:acyl dehydratase